jgi:hypothetical protein
MNTTRSHLTSTVPALMLLFVSVFRLGDCPCGCPEHNIWVELAGLGETEVAVSPVRTAAMNSDGNEVLEHSCASVPLGHYVDNSRVPNMDEPEPASQRTVALCQEHTIALATSMRSDFAKAYDDTGPPSRPALKVYLL